MKTRSFFLIAFAFSYIILFNSCENESPEPRDYPRLNTFEVTNISDGGALFSGELYSPGTQKLLEIGFAWGTHPTIQYSSTDKVILGNPHTGAFSAFISTTLVKGGNYYVRSFARTTECIVYGKAVAFKSLGSKGPEITGFSPDSAAWLDTIQIKGKNFSWIPNKNVVKLNGVICSVSSSSDTTLNVNIPAGLVNTESILTVEIAEQISAFITKRFKLIKPEIFNLSPREGLWGDTIYITGKRLSTANYLGNSVKIGSFTCFVLKATQDSIQLVVPHQVDKLSNPISINYIGLTITGKQYFQLAKPYFTFSPSTGIYGTKIILSGRFNGIANRNRFFIGNSLATVVSQNTKQVEILVPNDMEKAQNLIIYDVEPFSVSSAGYFNLKPPEITSFYPSSGKCGSLVTINGSNFGPGNFYYYPYFSEVKFGNVQANIKSWNNTQIIVYIPCWNSGLMRISVKVADQTAYSPQYFNVLN